MPRRILRMQLQERVDSQAGPPKVSFGTIMQIKRKVLRNPTLIAKNLKKDIPQLADVSVCTIQKICHNKMQLPSRKMANKPLINERMKINRLVFTRQHAHWGVEEWKKVMLSDESHFELRFGKQSFCCRRARGTDRFDPKFTRKRVKHPTSNVMVWGYFS
jgi:hypothetical protein